MDSFSIKFDRRQLYDEIWEISLTGVAKKYGLNYSKLAQICKDNNIPYPSTAYWSKKNMGLDFSDEIVELPESAKNQVEVPLKKSNISIDKSITDKEKFIHNFKYLNFLDEKEKNKVAEIIYDINTEGHKKVHKVITKYKNEKKEERREERKANYYNVYYNIHDYKEKGYFADISKLAKERCMKILSCVYYAIEELGGKVNDDFSLEVRGEEVNIEIEELTDKINHEITKNEAKALVEYEDRKRQFAYATKPNIRKYDYVPNGKLKLSIGNGNYIRENDKVKLEDKLGDVIIKLYEQSELIKVERTKREERLRKEKEEQERKERIRNNKQKESKKTQELINLADDYRIACDIRNYIEAVSKQENLTEELKNWIVWANKKANWIDPIIDEEDEILGKRNHTDSLEKKNNELEKLGSGYGWW